MMMENENLTSADGTDQLVFVVVSDEQVGELSSELVKNGFRLTMVKPHEGFIQVGSTCLLVGIPSTRYGPLTEIIETICKTRRKYIPTHGPVGMPEGLPMFMIEAEVGSAYVYRLDVDYFEQF
jgi:uncharacterized protein YaaQ